MILSFDVLARKGSFFKLSERSALERLRNRAAGNEAARDHAGQVKRDFARIRTDRVEHRNGFVVRETKRTELFDRFETSLGGVANRLRSERRVKRRLSESNPQGLIGSFVSLSDSLSGEALAGA